MSEIRGFGHPPDLHAECDVCKLKPAVMSILGVYWCRHCLKYPPEGKAWWKHLSPSEYLPDD